MGTSVDTRRGYNIFGKEFPAISIYCYHKKLKMLFVSVIEKKLKNYSASLEIF